MLYWLVQKRHNFNYNIPVTLFVLILDNTLFILMVNNIILNRAISLIALNNKKLHGGNKIFSLRFSKEQLVKQYMS